MQNHRLAVAAITMAVLAAFSISAAEGSPKKDAEDKPQVALNGVCAVCLVEVGKEMKGKPEFKSVHKGYEYHFPSADQKKMFDANPEKYAVQHGGECVVCQKEKGEKMKGDPGIFTIYNKKIYLFAHDKAKKMFEGNPEKYTGEKKAEGSAKMPPKKREGS